MDLVGNILREEEGKLFGVEGIDGCGGDACGVIATRATNEPGTQIIDVFYCRNTSNKPINVTFKWVNIVGGTGIRSDGRIEPGQEMSWSLRGFRILGYYSNAASYA